MCSTAAAKMFLFLKLDDLTDTVMPLKDAGSGQESQFLSIIFIYAEKVVWILYNGMLAMKGIASANCLLSLPLCISMHALTDSCQLMLAIRRCQQLPDLYASTHMIILKFFFAAADRSFLTIFDRCPDKSMSQVFQDFLTRFYSTDLSIVINNLFLLSKIGSEHEQVLYISLSLMFMQLTLYHNQNFGGIFFPN